MTDRSLRAPSNGQPSTISVVARSRESIWLALAGGLGGVAGVLLGISAAFGAATKGYSVWTSAPAIVAYVLFGLAAVCLACAAYDIPIPLPARGRNVEMPEQPDGPDPRKIVDAEIAGQATGLTEAATTKAGPAITDRWQHTSDGGQVPALMNLTHTGLFHPGYGGRQPQDVPPSIKIGILMACQPIDPTVSGTELRAKFAAFMATEPVGKLIGSLTDLDSNMSWRNLAGNGPRVLEAALTAGESPLDGVPMASALLIPPVAGESLYGRNGRSATLLLYVEPRTAGGQVPSASDLAAWHERFNLALAIPAAFAEFLAKDLGLATSDDPPTQFGIWLQSHHPLTTMVDTQGMTALPGSSPSNWFAGWAFATSEGKTGMETVRDLLRELCEYTLHLDNFEQKLDEISATEFTEAAVNSTRQSRNLPTAAELLAKRFDAEWAADIALFKKLGNQPSFREVSDALQRGAQLDFISKHGLRAPLDYTSCYLRIPHPDDWAIDVIPLHLEKRFLDDILFYEWTPDQSFVDVAHSLATALRDTLYWEGEGAYYPEVALDQFASFLLYGIETVRKGYGGAINRIFQIVGNDWIITEWEIIDKANHYQILFRRFNELDWISHVSEKGWVQKRNFLEAFETAEMLIHRKVFEGELPPDWTPPKEWPFDLS